MVSGSARRRSRRRRRERRRRRRRLRLVGLVAGRVDRGHGDGVVRAAGEAVERRTPGSVSCRPACCRGRRDSRRRRGRRVTRPSRGRASSSSARTKFSGFGALGRCVSFLAVVVASRSGAGPFGRAPSPRAPAPRRPGSSSASCSHELVRFATRSRFRRVVRTSSRSRPGPQSTRKLARCATTTTLIGALAGLDAVALTGLDPVGALAARDPVGGPACR